MLGVLLGWVVTLLMVGLALEVVLRLFGARPIVTINAPDREFGWVKRKNESTRKVTGEYDVTFTINELGVRGDADLTRAKPAGTQRVLFVGDSFVLGYTVDRPDHFVDLVGQAFARDGRAIQVLNGGTEGYSTDQEALWLAREGIALAPDVVVLCFFQNDVYWNTQKSYAGTPKPRIGRDGSIEPVSGSPPPPRGWLARNTSIGGLLDGVLNSRFNRAQMLYEAGATRMERDQAVALKSPPAEFADGWARTSASFQKAKADCEAASIRLLVVAIPSREEIEPGALERWAADVHVGVDEVDPDSPAQKALASARKLGLATLDPREALKAAASDGTRLYFEKDWHVNPRGSRLLAEAIYGELTKPQFLGGGATPAALASLHAPLPKSFPRWPFVVGGIWLLLSLIYARSYRDEKLPSAFLKVGAMIGAVVAIVLGFNALVELLPPRVGRLAGVAILLAFVGYLGWKLLPKLAIMREVHASFVRHGKWYMLPLIVVMLSIGGLLVVASSSPFIAPFIYTLF